jgi:hypothetical protein
MKRYSFFILVLILSLFFGQQAASQNIIEVTEGINKLDDAIFEAEAGDIIELVTNGGYYYEFFSIIIDKPLTIRAAEHLVTKPVIISDDGSRMIDLRDDLTLQGVILDGKPGLEVTGSGVRVASDSTLVKHHYNLLVENCVFKNLDEGVRGDGGTYAGMVIIRNSYFQDMGGRAVRFRDPCPPPVSFTIENSTFWNTLGEAIYVDHTVGIEETPEFLANQITIHNGGDRPFYPRSFPNAVIRNSIVTDTAPGEGRAARIYGESIIENFLFHNKPDSIQLSDGATMDVEKILQQVDPLYLAPELGNFRLAENSPAVGFGSEGQPLGNEKWWPTTPATIDIDGGFGDWALVDPLEMTENDPAIPDTFELKAGWVSVDDEKIAFRMDFFDNANINTGEGEGRLNIWQRWHRIIFRDVENNIDFRISSYVGTVDTSSFTRARWRIRSSPLDIGHEHDGERFTGAIAWNEDGTSAEFYIPLDSLYITNGETTFRIEKFDSIQVRYHIEAGGEGIGKNYLPAGTDGSKLTDDGGYYTIWLGDYYIGNDDIPVSIGDDRITSLPLKYTLEQNYPNPFNPTTTISYAIPEAAEVRLSLYNVLGQQIVTLVDEQQPAGTYTVQWDGHTGLGGPASSGVYFYRLEAGDHVITKKMLLLK